MSNSRSATPRASPSRNPAQSLTAAQKQLILENLHFEVAERARKLRAEYSLHAQSIRSRLELRINRIPRALRTINIEELVSKYAESLEEPKARPLGTLKQAPISRTPAANSSQTSFHSKGTKRSSDEMLASDDKENQGVLPLPGKRAKLISAVPGSSAARAVTATSASGTQRANSRTARGGVNPAQVLSPKSHNSRTLPISPLKNPAASPGKSYLARPVSPAKPAAAQITIASAAADTRPARGARGAAQKSATTAATSLRGKKATVPATAYATGTVRTRTRANSNGSTSSGTSNGTTVVKKKLAQPATTATGTGTGTVKRGLMSKVTGIATAAGRRAAGKKDLGPAVVQSETTGRRVLRSRKAG